MKTIKTVYTGYDNIDYPARATATKKSGRWIMLENKYFTGDEWIDTGDEWTQPEMVNEFE